MSTFLNVILHGLHVLVERPSAVEVLIPDMGAEHTYRAGEWLGEIILPPGEYWLSGVVPGKDTCKDTQNIIVKNCQPVAKPDYLYARLVLPKPECFYHKGQVTLDMSELEVIPPVTVTSMTVSTIQVLRYRIVDDDPKNVRLGCHHFTKSAQFRDGDYYMSLHVFSAPDWGEIPKHAMRGFNNLVNMGETTVGRIALRKTKKVPAETKTVPGVILPEFVSLAKRVELLTYTGRFLRENLLAKAAAQLDPDVFVGIDGDIVTCSNLVYRTGV
jgi:hypothetical protein